MYMLSCTLAKDSTYFCVFHRLQGTYFYVQHSRNQSQQPLDNLIDFAPQTWYTLFTGRYSYMDNEIKMMLNAILEEIAHVDERVNKRFDKVEAQLDSLQHEVNACKLERESIGLLIKKIDQLESRIEELEKRTA